MECGQEPRPAGRASSLLDPHARPGSDKSCTKEKADIILISIPWRAGVHSEDTHTNMTVTMTMVLRGIREYS